MQIVNQGSFRRIGWTAVVFFLAWGIIRYFLPLIAPFLLGWIFASMAEPMTSLLHRRLGLNRTISSGLSVTMVLTVLLGILWLAGALGYREITVLAARVPEYADQLTGKFSQLRDWMVGLVSRLPGGMREMMAKTVTGMFTEGSVLLDKAASGAISAAGSVAGRIPGGALLIGTAVVSAYMISGQYPALKERLKDNPRFRERWEPMLKKLWSTVRLWIKAQLKLSAMTFGIVGAGFLLLRVENWIAWALVTAIVDAVPILGTGTVLIPMALISFLWGERARGIGLAALYVTAMLTRSAMEPRLVGRQLGMNPLLTLMALYAGFQIWGIWGMILSPILAVTVRQLAFGGE